MNVAIVGRPNVGKSALFNRLVGRKIAIVHGQPGITRDRISAVCQRGDRPFTLSDTGGVAGTGESELAAEVERVARETIRESDVLILVVDGKMGLSPIDSEIARMVRKSGKPSILVINKIDNVQHENLAADFDSLGFEHSNSVSAEHNRGIAELLEHIEQLLPAAPPDSRFTIHDSLAIAILGRPNVGKSSLINSIVRSERAIVSELPGTTRDAVDIFYQGGGKLFTFIDTAGIRRRRKHSSSVEVFSVMRAERSIRRADLCVLIVDLTAGITAQDKRIAGLIQEAGKPCVVVLNKWDLVKPKQNAMRVVIELVKRARETLFFLDYAQVLVASALTHENVDRLFGLIEKTRAASQARIGTGFLNRLLGAAFAANPPPMRKGKRLKLFYATQAAEGEVGASKLARQTAGRVGPAGGPNKKITPPEFLLFVNDPRLLSDHYERYLVAKLREIEPYSGLPVILTLRPRSKQW